MLGLRPKLALSPSLLKESATSKLNQINYHNGCKLPGIIYFR